MKMTNPSGESGLVRKRTDFAGLAAVLLASLLLASCAGSQPAPVEDRNEVEREVREPAQEDSAGVQVRPLQNPAVIELLAQAGDAEDHGRYDDAALLLERALRIQPHDPELLQQMAEIQLQQKDYQQALNFAVRSYDSGSRVGEICARNWHTISLARDRLGDSSGSREAEQRAGQCMSTRPDL
jgi:tetratricopeptide (TPR) repeat protein